MTDSPKHKARPKVTDLALLHGPTEDGEGARIIRYRDGELSAGEVRPLKEGQPLNDQTLLRLRPVERASPLCEVEVVVDPQATPARGRSGPARVTNPTYRRNWQQVFDKRKRRAEKPQDDFSVN